MPSPFSPLVAPVAPVPIARTGPDLPLPERLRRLDEDRRARYRQMLDLYGGAIWQGRARRGERRLTFNYLRAFVDKAASYLLSGITVQVEPIDPDDPASQQRARAAERALRVVEAENALAELDFDDGARLRHPR